MQLLLNGTVNSQRSKSSPEETSLLQNTRQNVEFLLSQTARQANTQQLSQATNQL